MGMPRPERYAHHERAICKMTVEQACAALDTLVLRSQHRGTSVCWKEHGRLGVVRTKLVYGRRVPHTEAANGCGYDKMLDRGVPDKTEEGHEEFRQRMTTPKLAAHTMRGRDASPAMMRGTPRNSLM